MTEDVTLNNKLVLSRKKVILFKLNEKIIKTKPEGRSLLLRNLKTMWANVFRVHGCMKAWKFLNSLW